MLKLRTVRGTGSAGNVRSMTASNQRLARPAPSAPEHTAPSSYSFTVKGQVPGGKNRIGITRTGHHYPNQRFITWRKDAAEQIIQQKHAQRRVMLMEPVILSCWYWPGDNRTRDLDGMLSALYYLLVYAGVLKNDGLIYDQHWHRYAVSHEPKIMMELKDWKS